MQLHLQKRMHDMLAINLSIATSIHARHRHIFMCGHLKRLCQLYFLEIDAVPVHVPARAP